MPSMDNAQGWQAVAEWINAELAKTEFDTGGEIAEASGVSVASWRRLRTGEPIIRQDILRKVARFLKYTPDAIDRVREGKKPTPLPDASPDLERRMDAVEAAVRRQESQIAEVLHRLDQGVSVSR